MDIYTRRKALTDLFFSRYGYSVQAGPFKGMILPDTNSWVSDGDKLPKVLGQYESELHEFLLPTKINEYDIVVNVGCAEGFYAIGLAFIHTNALVYAFDTDPRAQELCKISASINGVDSRLRVSGFCDPSILEFILSQGSKCLLVCDVEGYELHLIEPSKVPSLAKTTIIVECHDFMNREITPIIKTRLSKSHSVRLISEGERNPNLHDFQKKLGSLDRWLTVCEFRPEKMHWLCCAPKIIDESSANQIHCKPEAINEDEVQIFLAANENYTRFLMATMRSIIRHTNQRERIKFHILSRDLQESTKAKIREIAPDRVEFMEVDMDHFKTFPQMKMVPHLTVEAYFRYLIPDLWPNLSRAVYLDCDVIVKDDICKLWDFNLDNYVVAACEEGWDYVLTWKKELGIKGFYFNSGVMIWDLKKFREHGIVEKLFSKTLEIGDRAKFADQDILNLVLDGHAKLLPARYNIQLSTCEMCEAGTNINPEFVYKLEDLQDALKSPAIIHYNSPPKPIHSNCTHPFKNDWFLYADG